MRKILCILSLVVVASACGNKEGKKEVSKPAVETQTPKEAAAPVSTSAETLTIELSSNDQMQFDKAVLKAQAGQTIALTLIHTGTMAKNVMGHNFVLLQQGVDIPTFAEEAMAAIDLEYIPEGNEVIAHTKLIGGGESDTITFTAPAPGTYDFICSFPGHYGIMKGKFIVE
ncbi:MAG: azurin [Lutibacter sp.]|jgi:azurin|nr:azurin [Lutibacter sp.]